MYSGVNIENASGRGGWVEAHGLGSRPALLGKWSLEKREVSGPDGPVWRLRASLPYQNDALRNFLAKQKIQMRFYLELSKEKRYEAVPESGVEPLFEQGFLTIERLHLCVA